MNCRARIRPRFKPFFRLLPALFLSAFMHAPDATAAEWRPFGLQGIVVRSLAVAPGRLCAGTAGKGVYCLDATSQPVGWRSLGPDGATITGLWIDGKRPGLIFAAADSQPGVNVLFRSLDGGRTWQDLGGNIPPSPVSEIGLVHGVPGTNIVYGAGGAVWISDDLGDHWIMDNPGEPVEALTSQSALEVAPTDPQTVWAGGDLAFSFGPEAYAALSRDGGQNWKWVWSAGPFSYTPIMDISAHPRLDGLALTGHGGYVLRTPDHGASFRMVLQSSVYFLVDWGGGGVAFAAGSTTSLGGSEAYVSRDLGDTWTPITGTRLGRLKINDLEADDRLTGLAFAATSDGVYAFFGAGNLLCHDARQGVDSAILWLGECPPIMSPGPAILGDAIVADGAALRAESDHVDLGAVHCIVENSDIAFATLDLPDPPAGELFLILARQDGAADYGVSSDGLPRRASIGDCL